VNLSGVVVFTHGRTGSHLLCANLAKWFEWPLVLTKEVHTWPSVIHAHNPLFNKENCINVLSYRKDLFSVAISTIVKKHQMSSGPITISDVEFDNFIIYSKAFNHLIRTTKSNLVEIEYESMITDPSYVSLRFGMNTKIDLSATKREESNMYSSFVTNYQYLYHRYAQNDVELDRDTLQFAIKNMSDLFPVSDYPCL